MAIFKITGDGLTEEGRLTPILHGPPGSERSPIHGPFGSGCSPIPGLPSIESCTRMASPIRESVGTEKSELDDLYDSIDSFIRDADVIIQQPSSLTKVTPSVNVKLKHEGIHPQRLEMLKDDKIKDPSPYQTPPSTQLSEDGEIPPTATGANASIASDTTVDELYRICGQPGVGLEPAFEVESFSDQGPFRMRLTLGDKKIENNDWYPRKHPARVAVASLGVEYIKNTFFPPPLIFFQSMRPAILPPRTPRAMPPTIAPTGPRYIALSTPDYIPPSATRVPPYTTQLNNYAQRFHWVRPQYHTYRTSHNRFNGTMMVQDKVFHIGDSHYADEKVVKEELAKKACIHFMIPSSLPLASAPASPHQVNSAGIVGAANPSKAFSSKLEILAEEKKWAPPTYSLCPHNDTLRLKIGSEEFMTNRSYNSIEETSEAIAENSCVFYFGCNSSVPESGLEDYISILHNICYKLWKKYPTFNVASGKDGFTCSITLPAKLGQIDGDCTYRKKKAAKKDAAKKAVQFLQLQQPNWPQHTPRNDSGSHANARPSKRAVDWLKGQVTSTIGRENEPPAKKQKSVPHMSNLY